MTRFIKYFNLNLFNVSFVNLDLQVKRKVFKSGPNNGREFFTCPKPYIPACTSSFQWCEEHYSGLLPRLVLSCIYIFSSYILQMNMPCLQRCSCGNQKVKKTVKNEGPNHGR